MRQSFWGEPEEEPEVNGRFEAPSERPDCHQECHIGCDFLLARRSYLPVLKFECPDSFFMKTPIS